MLPHALCWCWNMWIDMNYVAWRNVKWKLQFLYKITIFRLVDNETGKVGKVEHLKFYMKMSVASCYYNLIDFTPFCAKKYVFKSWQFLYEPDYYRSTIEFVSNLNHLIQPRNIFLHVLKIFYSLIFQYSMYLWTKQEETYFHKFNLHKKSDSEKGGVNASN